MRSRATIRARSRLTCSTGALGAAALALFALLASAGGSHGASSSTVVTATVPSATNLVASGCAAGSAGSTSLGVVLPGSIGMSTADCTVVFDSSNDTALLRLTQSDGTGIAMHREPAGSPYGTFGTGGTSVWSVTTNDTAYGIAIQADGKPIVIEQSGFVTRLTPTGALDPTWGTGGIANHSALADQLRGLELDAQGRAILVARRNPASSFDFAVRRLTATGSSDPTFNGGAWSTINIQGAADDEASDVVVLDDGKLIIVGTSMSGGRDIAAVRLHANGSLDTTYGTGGITKVDNDYGGAVYPTAELAPDGNLLIASRSAGAVRFIRLLADGTPDPAFGVGGVADIAVPGSEEDLRDVAVLDDGRPIAVGNYDGAGASTGTLVVRTTTTGAPDPAFGGGDGIATLQLAPAAEDVARSALLQPDGTLLVAGRIDTGPPDLLQAYTARINLAGELDPRYGTSGIAILSATASDDDRVLDGGTLAWGPEGRVFVTGDTKSANRDSFVHVIEADPVPDYNAGVNDWVQPGVAAFGGCLERVTNASAAGSWLVAGADNCTAANAANWNAVAATAGPAASIASTTSGTLNGTVELRFGFRTTTTQKPGSYWAPLTFEVIAPAA